MTEITTARVPTENAGRYLQQLCKHWSHRFPSSFDETAGQVALPGAALSLVAADDHLAVTLVVDDTGDVARLRQVVAEHLDRFAFREAPLRFDWQ